MKSVIVVPSRERASILLRKTRHTMHYLASVDRPKYLVVDYTEADSYGEYSGRYGMTILPTPHSAGVDRIYKAYDYAQQQVLMRHPDAENIIFMDDDLIFAMRDDFSSPKLRTLNGCDGPTLIAALEQALEEEGVAMAGFAHRRGAQTHTTPKRYNQKLIAVLACKVNAIRDKKWDWGVESMFDHNMVLTLLTEGWRNVQLSLYTHDDILPRHSSGGCTAYRSMDTHSEAAKALAKKFPGVVTLRDKYNQDLDKWGLDVTIHVKKFFGE